MKFHNRHIVIAIIFLIGYLIIHVVYESKRYIKINKTEKYIDSLTHIVDSLTSEQLNAPK